MLVLVWSVTKAQKLNAAKSVKKETNTLWTSRQFKDKDKQPMSSSSNIKAFHNKVNRR